MTGVVHAAAKLTLSLRITGVRPDGFHLIDAEMVELSLHDVLTIATSEAGSSVSVGGPYADGVPSDGSNLVSSALEATGRSASIEIEKNIPSGGGLGGGSADAAAVLRWAGWTATPETLERASRIGADVAFCVVGGRARVRGIGEIVEPLPFLDRRVTLVIPPLSVSTPAVYRAWDRLGAPTAAGPNDLEPAAIAVEPALGRWRDLIGDACGRSPILAGSGATWFVHGEHSNALAAVGNEGADIIVARTARRPDDVSSGAGGHDGRTT